MTIDDIDRSAKKLWWSELPDNQKRGWRMRGKEELVKKLKERISLDLYSSETGARLNEHYEQLLAELEAIEI